MRVLATLVLFGAMAAPASGATHVIRWSPFVDGTLRPGLAAPPAFGGDCFTGSFAVHSAYRCADGNFLRDPCFADPTRDYAVRCVRDPFSRGVLRLRVNVDLDRSGSAPLSLVWAVRFPPRRRRRARRPRRLLRRPGPFRVPAAAGDERGAAAEV